MEKQQRQKVVLIGPVLPFRGGIAQHTTRLRGALEEHVDVHTISFSRLYPASIFPGKSDRDPELAGHEEPHTDYTLDSISPISWRKVARSVIRTEPDLVVIPWWTVFFAPCFGYLASRFRRAGIPVVFMCHNTVEHESAPWKRMFTRAVLGRGSAYVTQTLEDRDNLLEILPRARVVVQPHPIYDQFPPARGTLKRAATTELLFFGFVRPYKGLDVLLEAMALLGDKDVRLTVAGEVWGDQEVFENQAAELGITDRVEFVTRYLGDAEVAEYFDRSDWVVLPYRSATGTGVVPIAYHYLRPVIVTRVGGLPDVVREGVTGFVVEPESPRALADAIERATSIPAGTMSAGIEEIKKEFSWDRLALAVLGVAPGSGEGAGPAI